MITASTSSSLVQPRPSAPLVIVTLKPVGAYGPSGSKSSLCSVQVTPAGATSAQEGLPSSNVKAAVAEAAVAPRALTPARATAVEARKREVRVDDIWGPFEWAVLVSG